MMRRMLPLAGLLAAMPLCAQVPQAAAPTTAPADTARLALASRVIDRLMPAGTYRRLMSGSMDKMMSGMADQMMTLPVRDFAALGLPPEKVAKIGPGSLREITAILDPAFQERLRRMMDLMTRAMADTIGQLEPRLKAGMAQAYATRFTEPQLAEIDRFFSTPTGSAYAAQSMTIMADPAVLATMQDIMPAMLKSMARARSKFEAATTDLPKPRKVSDLSPDERKRLGALLGTDPATLDTPAKTK